MKLGCHVSNSGKFMLEGSVKEALINKANTFMVYLGPPQNTRHKAASELKIKEMKILLKENNLLLKDVIIHAPYIVNLAQPDQLKRQYGIDFFTREILNAEVVGAKYFVIHPGAHVGQGVDKGLELIIDSLKQILDNTKDTEVSICIETMSGKGTECCFSFSHIKTILDSIDSERLAVCFDTCHTHDAGYDLINDYQKVMTTFDEIIGLDKIKVFHINDSKNKCGAKKDRHENIGFGEIGFDTLLKVIYDQRFKDIPMILETPFIKDGDNSISPYKAEIEMIRNKEFDCDLIEKIKKG